jgi:serpin B
LHLEQSCRKVNKHEIFWINNMKRIYPLYAFLLLIIVLITSCKKDNSTKPGAGKDLKLSAAELQQASADNTFSFNLFRSVAAQNPNANLFMSPLSISMALGMTTNGANGSTLDSMRKTLNFGGFSQGQVNMYYNDLLAQLPELDPNTTLKIANSVWYKNTFSVLPQFLETETQSYNAKVQALDFSNPSSLNTINDWVNRQTGGKISKVINSIDPQDVMYLINAIYFKSMWANKFDPSNTKTMTFIPAGDYSTTQTPFMRGTVNCNTYSGNDMTLLELPYSNNKYSMVIALPGAGKSVSDILSGLDSTQWQNWMAKLSPSKAEVDMPKFAFSYSTSLKNNLSAMGMGIAFNDGADFSNINGTGGLKISSVTHKAYVAVDENGTTAAAATTVTVIPTDVLIPSRIVIDHPFLFVIREMKTGLIVFTGIVNDPTQSGQ